MRCVGTKLHLDLKETARRGEIEPPWYAQSAIDVMAVSNTDKCWLLQTILSYLAAQKIRKTTYALHTDENRWELHYTDDIHRSPDSQVSDVILTSPSQS
jgi:hypothetical protein